MKTVETRNYVRNKEKVKHIWKFTMCRWRTFFWRRSVLIDISYLNYVRYLNSIRARINYLRVLSQDQYYFKQVAVDSFNETYSQSVLCISRLLEVRFNLRLPCLRVLLEYKYFYSYITFFFLWFLHRKKYFFTFDISICLIYIYFKETI